MLFFSFPFSNVSIQFLVPFHQCGKLWKPQFLWFLPDFKPNQTFFFLHRISLNRRARLRETLWYAESAAYLIETGRAKKNKTTNNTTFGPDVARCGFESAMITYRILNEYFPFFADDSVSLGGAAPTHFEEPVGRRTFIYWFIHFFFGFFSDRFCALIAATTEKKKEKNP